MKDVNILLNYGANIQKSLELFGDMATYDETLVEFLKGIDQKLSEIDKYKNEFDTENYAILVHSLKSDARYFGFEVLGELAYQHELAGKEPNIEFINDHYEELMKEAYAVVNVVRQYLGGTVTEVVAADLPKGKAILVIDDSDVVRSYVQRIFKDEFDVLVATDGNEAIDILKTPTKDNIIAVLLDLNLPTVSGFEVLKFFEENNLFLQIPVSIITGNDTKDMVEEAFKYPVTDVLSKPFNEANVRMLIEKTINHKN